MRNLLQNKGIQMNRIKKSIWLALWAVVFFSSGAVLAEESNSIGGIAPDADKVIKQVAQYYKGLRSFRVSVATSTTIHQASIKQYNQDVFSLTMQRPNRLAMVLQHGLSSPTVIANSKQTYVYQPMMGQYLYLETPADFAGFFQRGNDAGETLRSTIPLLDALLADTPYESIIRDILSATYLGRSDIDTISCHHLRFTQKQIDWDLWIEAAEAPRLRRIAPDLTRLLNEARQFQPDQTPTQVRQEWNFTDWKTNTEVADDVFQATPAPGAQEVLGFDRPGEEPQHPLVGQAAPNCNFELLDGTPVQLAQHRGKQIVVLEFWATWCGPCRYALPFVAAAANKYKDQNVVFYAVDQNEDPQKITSFLEKAKLKVTVAIDKSSQAAGRYGVSGIPHTVLIDKEGTVQSVHVGAPNDKGARIERELAALVAGKNLALKPLAAGTCDLTCKSATFSPAPVKVGEKVTFSCVLANSGTGAISPGRFLVLLLVDGREVYSAPVNVEIPAGGETRYNVDAANWYLQLLSASTHNYRLRVDPDNRITETDESNNALEGIFEVTPADH
jgi:peroxiredoxin